MFGALPIAFTYYWHMKMPETPRYTALGAMNAGKASEDFSKLLVMNNNNSNNIIEQVQAVDQRNDVVCGAADDDDKKGISFGLFSKMFARRHGLHLLGTASTWLLLDVSYFSQNLFQKEIFTAVGWLPAAHTMGALDELFNFARAQTLVALCGLIPGYWVTVILIDIIGRVTIQLIGFFFMTVFMLALAIPYHHWIQKHNSTGFVVMYALTFFFANFGPNSTTFIVPAEIFPARFRSTCHGISAAAGKAGAIIGAFGFLYAAQDQDKSKADPGYPAGIGIKNTLFLLAAVNVLGLLFTFLVPEPNGRSLEEISGEIEECESNKSNPIIDQFN